MSLRHDWILCICLLTPLPTLNADGPIPARNFVLPDHLEATVWAKAPMFYNPTNIDVDERGRVWVTEAVNYRNFNSNGDGRLTHEGGDRVVVLEDTNNDGTADKSTVFIQEKDLVAPLGIAVFENRVVVSCSPSLILYTDTNRDGRFDVSVDKKEKLLTGFGGLDHDHGLHAVVAGPDGRWYFNVGNAGSHTVTDKTGWTLRAGGWYTGGTPYNTENTPGRKSDDGHIYVGGLAMSINPDGSGLAVYAHNFRNNYEVTLDSLGNMFQNDNDDQVAACRTTWLMQHANAGYSSADGQRSWQADQRPDQSIPIAHWHQDDPGVIPFGDLYGAGSPTGMVVYESAVLGEQFRGMLLSCEAGRNVVLSYDVQTLGAGFDLRRSSFFTSGLPDDPTYEWKNVEQDQRRWFRPSDVAVGPDGAIYVADWFDPIVGGHAMHDRIGAGTIYRIAPKDRRLTTPNIDLNTLEGQIAALKSPAPNVRFVGFERLRARGDEALAAVMALRDDKNSYIRARAIWLMAQLGDAGRGEVFRLLEDEDSNTRVVAFRALRQAGVDVLPYARRLAIDPSPAVRREVALAMRSVPIEQSLDILVDVAVGFDGRDRWYLEAFGTGCDEKEDAMYTALNHQLGGPPELWDERFAGLIWRLHPVGAIAPLKIRAMSSDLTRSQRKEAIDTLAFIQDTAAGEAMIEIASRGPSDLRDNAAWWIDFRSNNLWREFTAARRFSRHAHSTPTELNGVQLPPHPAYTSEVIRRGSMSDVRVNITGAERLYLVVTDADDGNACDWADWAEPRLVGPQGEVNLTTLPWDKATSRYGQVLIDRNCKNMPLSIDGRSVPFGIGTHASSVIVYDISGLGFEEFAARGGLDNGRHDLGGTDFADGDPSVVFHVYHDGPTPELRALANEAIVLDAAAELPRREAAALAMARSKEGGMRLLSMASKGMIADEMQSRIGKQIHLNPDLTVRALAGQYFPRSAADGQTFPAIQQLVKMSGDEERGKALVFGRAQCADCHMFSGRGKSVGPDLTGIGRKLDRSRLFDSIINPSASIVFGYEPWLIETDDGRVVTGFVVGEGDPVLLKDAKGEQHAISAETIEFRRRQSVSIMPEVVEASLNPQELTDIVEFLMSQSSAGP